MVFSAIDIDDVEQAIEIGCGDTIGVSVSSGRIASERDQLRLCGRLERLVADLPAETSVGDLLEVTGR